MKIKRDTALLIAVFAAALAVVLWLMPRPNKHKYNYEENRPWGYSLLTAPFDITVYRDSATVNAMLDSIHRNMVPIFRRDNETPARVLAAISAARSLSAPTRGSLSELVRQLYERGITDQTATSAITAGSLTEVKFRENNTNVAYPTAEFLSQRDAYAMIDSIFRNNPERHNIHRMELARLLMPNIVEDTEATNAYRESLEQPVRAGIGVIQKGERIIDRGDIVTPQLYQVLKTYEATLEKQSDYSRSSRLIIFLGRFLFAGLIFGALPVYLALYSPQRLKVRPVGAILLLMTGFFVFTTAMSGTFMSGIYLVPLAMLPVIVLVFFDSRTAFFIYVLEVMLCSVWASFQFEYFVVQTVAGTAVIFSLKELSRRSQLLRSAVIAFAVYCLAYLGVELMSTGTLTSSTPRLIGYFAVNSVLISFGYILIFVFEKMFGLVSVVTLVELSDINTPLLRQLSEECPGTFQHSMAVSNLASEAAHRIGANVQLVRAGALYHDIGKIRNPAFFTENQHGVNPHDALTPAQSARIVIGHVTDGVRSAEKAKLPQAIIDFILQHHGAGKAKYFYTMEQRAHPGEEVDPAPFTYPGPNPQTREASLLMMADAVEAASRSMTDHSDEAIRNLVDRLIDSQVHDGLHNDSPLSFKDISLIKEAPPVDVSRPHKIPRRNKEKNTRTALTPCSTPNSPRCCGSPTPRCSTDCPKPSPPQRPKPPCASITAKPPEPI